MNFEQNNLTGELWLRDPSGKKNTANVVLSSIYEKYKTILPFYTELTNNNIRRFDVFYDTIFLETDSGFILEKIQTINDSITFFNNNNYFTPHVAPKPGYVTFNTRPGYWFDEKNNQIFYTIITPLEINKNFSSRFLFTVLVNIYNCNTGTINSVLFDIVGILLKEIPSAWDSFNCVVEDPVITFNPSSRQFNISFLIKDTERQMGIVSLNLKKGDAAYYDEYQITEINGHLPFFNIDEASCFNMAYDPAMALPFHIVTVAKNKKDPAYNEKYIRVTIKDPDDNFIDKYLVLE